jgi:arginase family enzyme
MTIMGHVATADAAMGVGIATFLGAPHISAKSDDIRTHGARAAFLGIPYEGANVYRYGQSGGPRAVREATGQFFSYHYDYDVDLFDVYSLVDCGDVSVVPADVPGSHDAMRHATLELLRGGALPLIQGGDHSIPLGTMKALSEFTDGAIGLIQFDCHLDSSDVAHGSRLTGASHLRRTSELPNVNPRNIVHIGSRGLWNLPNQVEYCRSAGIHVYRMRDVRKRGIEQVVREALELAGDGTNAIALDVDLDALDCPHAPGVCSPEPGGLHSTQLLEGIDIIGESGRISLLEVVELAPIWDPGGLGARMACYVMFTLLGANAKNLVAGGLR